jgi:hypothetical protein
MKFGQKALVIAGALALGTALVWTASAKAADNEYAGYQIKNKLVGSFGASTVQNVVEVSGGTFTKCKAKFLLVATNKNGGGIANPGLNYLCWQCKGAKPVASFTVTDQFAGGAVSTKKLKMICNPAALS